MHALSTEHVLLSINVIVFPAVSKYTREAGVRSLERHLGSICRAVALKVAEGEADPNNIVHVIDAALVEDILGVRKKERQTLVLFVDHCLGRIYALVHMRTVKYAR